MNESEIKSRIYSIIKNYIQKRDWINYDNFDISFSNMVFDEFLASHYDIEEIVKKIKTPFFKLNNLARSDFLAGGIGYTLYNFLIDVDFDVAISIQDVKIAPIQLFVDDIDSFNKSVVEALIPDNIRLLITKIFPKFLIAFTLSP